MWPPCHPPLFSLCCFFLEVKPAFPSALAHSNLEHELSVHVSGRLLLHPGRCGFSGSSRSWRPTPLPPNLAAFSPSGPFVPDLGRLCLQTMCERSSCCACLLWVVPLKVGEVFFSLPPGRLNTTLRTVIVKCLTTVSPQELFRLNSPPFPLLCCGKATSNFLFPCSRACPNSL